MEKKTVERGEEKETPAQRSLFLYFHLSLSLPFSLFCPRVVHTAYHIDGLSSDRNTKRLKRKSVKSRGEGGKWLATCERLSFPLNFLFKLLLLCDRHPIEPLKLSEGGVRLRFYVGFTFDFVIS